MLSFFSVVSELSRILSNLTYRWGVSQVHIRFRWQRSAILISMTKRFPYHRRRVVVMGFVGCRHNFVLMKVRPISWTLSGQGDVSKVIVAKQKGQGIHLRRKLLGFQCFLFFLIMVVKKMSKELLQSGSGPVKMNMDSLHQKGLGSDAR